MPPHQSRPSIGDSPKAPGRSGSEKAATPSCRSANSAPGSGRQSLRFEINAPTACASKREPVRSRVLPLVRAAWRWLDGSLLGDLVGALCLFGILFGGLFLTLLVH